MEATRRSSQADLIDSCAHSVETAVVGVLSVTLVDERTDEELQRIKHELIQKAHELREIGMLLNDERKRKKDG